jgi:hypothetical protein
MKAGGKVALGQVLLQVILFSSVNIILCTHILSGG